MAGPDPDVDAPLAAQTAQPFVVELSARTWYFITIKLVSFSVEEIGIHGPESIKIKHNISMSQSHVCYLMRSELGLSYKHVRVLDAVSDVEGLRAAVEAIARREDGDEEGGEGTDRGFAYRLFRRIRSRL